ncbi:LEA type 2 family protein [Gilvimarinus sp. F26214L]|uniref:LEA type 2 family protein n=1 Tax=Gilvimarinus sp. DZF01 TaxID=3461371 RepID=UPI0040454D54
MRLQTRMPTVALLVAAAILLQACAGFSPALQKPNVTINSLKMVESAGLDQRFQIGLLLTNPNSAALPVTGMSYTLTLNGFDLVTGVSSEVPVLEPYSETAVTLEGSADLMAVARLINSLARKPEEKLRYELNARIDLQGWRPTLNISEDGLIEMQSLPR